MASAQGGGGFVQLCLLKKRQCQNPLVGVQSWAEFVVGWCSVCEKYSYSCRSCSNGPFGVEYTPAGALRVSRISEHRTRFHRLPEVTLNGALQQVSHNLLEPHVQDFDPQQSVHNISGAAGGAQALRNPERTRPFDPQPFMHNIPAGGAQALTNPFVAPSFNFDFDLQHFMRDMPCAAGGSQAPADGAREGGSHEQHEGAEEAEQADAEDLAARKIRVLAMMDLIDKRKRSKKPVDRIYADLLKELKDFRNRGGTAAGTLTPNAMQPEHVNALAQAHLFGASMVLVQATMWTGGSRQELTASVQGCQRVFKVVQGATVQWRLRCLGPEPVELNLTRGQDTGPGQRRKLFAGNTWDMVEKTTRATSCSLFQVSGKDCADDGVLAVEVIAVPTAADSDGCAQFDKLRL